jgi:hypothetical protein
LLSSHKDASPRRKTHISAALALSRCPNSCLIPR